MKVLALLLSVISGGSAGWGLFRLLFEGWDDFWECVRFWLTPDFLSALRGEWAEDQWAEMRLFLWGGATAACGYGGWALVYWLAS